MATIRNLQCRCGAVAGTLAHATAAGSNRIVCYCKDCRAAARWFDRRDLLDDKGGTDIFQVAPSQVTYVQGHDALRVLRLSDKGLLRSFCAHCKTPIGNTMGASMPFIGLSRSLLAGDVAWLPPAVPINEKSALSPVKTSMREQLPGLFHAVRLLLSWKFGGKGTPSPFFDGAGALTPTVVVLSPQQRATLAAQDNV